MALENYNAQNNINALENFIESLKTRDDLDLIFSIGTVTTKRLIKEIKDIPIVFTDLGAPEYSGGGFRLEGKRCQLHRGGNP